MTTRPVAIVTGGARGIGRGCAEALAAAGFDIAVTDLSEEKPLPMPAGGTTRFYEADMAKVDGHAPLADRIAADFGRIDCLVSNAGRGALVRGDPLDLKPENFDLLMGINLKSGIFFTQAVAKWMLAHPDQKAVRSISVITSVSAEMVSVPRVDYCITKAGLAMWVKGLALRLARDGIAVFDIRPGVIHSNMSAQAAPMYDKRIAEGLVPAMRWGEPSDIGGVVAALAGGAFHFSTGSVINVDGGLAIPEL
jgi:NAD(P)-dependent dehydrogenase (short-subunit alcohol dehydrogenase family)